MTFIQDIANPVDPRGKCFVAELEVPWVEMSFYAKQQLQKKPPLEECGVVIDCGGVERFFIPTIRTRTAGNGSVAVKCIDIASPMSHDEGEAYERVGIRLPTGAFTYAFFESQYLARAEDPRRGALFLIDPNMILCQNAMTEAQKQEFQTYGGKKVLYFDVLDDPNIKERRAEIQRCREKGDEQRRRYEEADRKWEEEREQRILQAQLDAAKPKLSKKAKQKARQALKKGTKSGQPEEQKEGADRAEDELNPDEESEQERLHTQRQAERRAKLLEDLKQEKEQDSQRKKLEMAEVVECLSMEAGTNLAVRPNVKLKKKRIEPSWETPEHAAHLEVATAEGDILVKGIDPAPPPGVKEDLKTESSEAGNGSLAAMATEDSKKDDSGADEERQFVTYQDGSTYTGMIKSGKRHGHGVWQSKSCQYEGQWKEDQQDGHGRQTWSDGRVYEGQFHKGRFSGTGKMVWHTQKGMLVYEGQYKDDLKDGHGMFIWPDGRTYDGEWREGKRHGRGTYITAKAERKVGYWVEDKFDRWEKDAAGLFGKRAVLPLSGFHMPE
ncbi:PIP5K3 [Symbiodinium pilosum]|uniref:PIP5K3 protein n=1 Tax=Symbiodinium pilosum TaxID=2952 RepID=A0A812QD01_SYMPI|nr:PIP5K3 [Symbiodinium pilosum]